MLIEKYKISKSIEFEKVLKSYILKNYDINSYSSVEPFILEMQQNRNVIINLNDIDKKYDSLKKHKEIIVQYLTMLNQLKTKVSFGKDSFSLKVEFSWKDVLKNDFYGSYNVNMEYYSNLFNLAVIYYNLGYSINPAVEEESKVKEGIKYFQHAAWLFDSIKNEFPSMFPAKETPPDMSGNFLTYVNIF